MKTTIHNLKNERCFYTPSDVYCGRGSKWGNPFSHKINSKASFIVPTRKEAIKKHMEWLLSQHHLLSEIMELDGKRLWCYCRPLECHCDNYVRIIGDINEKNIKS